MTTSQIVFTLLLVASFSAFGYTFMKIMRVLRSAKKVSRFDKTGERILTTLLVAFGQSKILRKPFAGFLHAIVWWGFLVITVGTIEMMIDGVAGTERLLSFMGPVYSLITASGELFAAAILIAVILFLGRRYLIKTKRFIAPEMKPASRLDATVILLLIFLLMVSLLLMNIGYIQSRNPYHGYFPVSELLLPLFGSFNLYAFSAMTHVNWWLHITLVLVFLNILPYSKHFHVIMAVPNVFLSRLEPKAKLNTMESITKEVKSLLDPNVNPYATPAEAGVAPEKFGIKDVTDVTWKHILDSYTCTECGRCTEVCPANNTGKKLSPRKLFIDLRKRVTEAGPDFIAGRSNGHPAASNRQLVSNAFISEEELWACTTCMACIQECPVSIDHVPFIVDMRRNLVMEESKVSSDLAVMFSNIENNGAPWAFSPDDRFNWAQGLDVPVMAEVQARGEAPEILFWVGCSGSFDDRSKSITVAFAKILKQAGVKFAVLGKEERCTGDPAKRAGNEMIYQMQALMNIQTLDMYNVKKIVTACPHCFNILKNEYPDLGGNYEVVHHSEFLKQLIEEGKIRVKDDHEFKNKKITYHDSCYIGRGNDIYEAPREVIASLHVRIREMKRSRSRGMCCGAGGAQMFKEEEKGKMRVNILRTEQALETHPDIIASACPFCMTMMTDGVKAKESAVKVYDIAELLAKGI
ncbi:MAG TPA: heterodisulfide reductase-related iron-sulfur binding cluster [Chitinophagales bacterium]|nr:heterodisulfide reductase-related iron-sulfur binding cluster [Chitinophagales bacterium]